jgi:L-alanine-DL-glutamate epimerase-like enolase superfamily enzyme
VAGWGEVVILAVPYGVIDDAVKAAGDALVGKDARRRPPTRWGPT